MTGAFGQLLPRCNRSNATRRRGVRTGTHHNLNSGRVRAKARTDDPERGPASKSRPIAREASLLVVYSTRRCESSLSLHNADIESNSLPKNRCAATDCPLSALGVVSRIELPFLN